MNKIVSQLIRLIIMKDQNDEMMRRIRESMTDEILDAEEARQRSSAHGKTEQL